jgi:hypothetical protein
MKKRRKGFSEIGLLFEGNQFWGTNQNWHPSDDDDRGRGVVSWKGEVRIEEGLH